MLCALKNLRHAATHWSASCRPSRYLGLLAPQLSLIMTCVPPVLPSVLVRHTRAVIGGGSPVRVWCSRELQMAFARARGDVSDGQTSLLMAYGSNAVTCPPQPVTQVITLNEDDVRPALPLRRCPSAQRPSRLAQDGDVVLDHDPLLDPGRSSSFVISTLGGYAS